MSVASRPSLLTWTERADRAALQRAGADVVQFAALRHTATAAAQQTTTGRTTLTNPAAPWLARVAQADSLAVIGVEIHDLSDLTTLYGHVLEPALRTRTPVVIESAHRLTTLAPERFVDRQFEYPYTLERALHAAMRLFRPDPGPDPGTHPDQPPEPEAGHGPPTGLAAAALDDEQRRAVTAHSGVVQVIAPAGSGKTTVLIERVRELLHRGTPAEHILCTTFNRDAALELQDRLRAAGLTSVTARTFHSIGWWLMREEGLNRANGIRDISLNQWRRLCAIVNQEEGIWIDPADARAAIADIKLGLLATPAEFRRRADAHENGSALARIYELHEQQLAEQQVNDFDDLVVVAVRALREDPALRRRWQTRFRQVLVDEYQDIEPAQELLVRILAAPEDGFFCVGDEDQTLYGWRRASVRRILDLDIAYPGLQRISLAHNYRCPPEVVEASRRLIERNRVRFPKPIEADPRRAPADELAPLALSEHADQPDAAEAVASELAGARRGETVVLARTTNLLRTAALAFAQRGVKIAAPEPVFEPHGARGALEAYLRLCAGPGEARAADVGVVLRTPSRGLPLEAEERVAALLREGLSFTDALIHVPATARQRARLSDAGTILDALAQITAAPRFIRYLRGPGGLNEYFTAHEQTFVSSEQIELEVLEQAEREASGRTVAEYAALLQARSDRLRAVRDDANGLELTTIHRAKGRQWPEVQLFAADEGQLPHHRALEVSAEARAAGEGLEAERRLAYVAFTRAQNTLVIHATRESPSRFLAEAGLSPSRPWQDPSPPGRQNPGPRRRPDPGPPRRQDPSRQRAGRTPVPGDAGAVLAEAERVGLAYALRTAPTRRAALLGAAVAVEQRQVGPQTASTRLTVTQLLEAIESLDADERAHILTGARVSGDTRVPRLGGKARSRLGHALRVLASGTAT